MTSIHRRLGRRVAYVKGAPKEVLHLCTHIYIDGNIKPLSQEWKDNVLRQIDSFAKEALRVLAVAFRELPDEISDLSVETVEKQIIFLGLTAMMDPPHPEVEEAVRLCHTAGIRVIMITGDYGLTAESIARRIGIIKEKECRIITGAEFEQMEDDDLTSVIYSGEVIFARVAPKHKMRVVSVLKKKGEIVAVTGDGINDAPALRLAEIGIAMGIAGTDVAKEASEMILLDDNFATIVKAIEEGRVIYANIKRFVTYIFASNVPEIIPFIIFVLSGGKIPLPLTIMQILAVDLGTDMLPAIALGMEGPEPGVMERPPRPKKKVGIFSNRIVLLGILCEIVLINLFIYVSPFQRVFGLTPIGLKDWGFLFIFTPILFFAEELRKLIIRYLRR